MYLSIYVYFDILLHLFKGFDVEQIDYNYKTVNIHSGAKVIREREANVELEILNFYSCFIEIM